MTPKQLAELLREMAQLIEAGDSYEGSIQYGCMDPDLPDGQFRVCAAYRIGNLNGQGGMNLIPVTPPLPE